MEEVRWKSGSHIKKRKKENERGKRGIDLHLPFAMFRFTFKEEMRLYRSMA